MEPISAIVTALALGASVIMKTAAQEAVKDAYKGLKELIRKRYAAVSPDLDQLEQTPDSKARRTVVEKGLEREWAQKDPELPQLAAQAQVLVELIRNQVPEVTTALGVDLKEIEAVNLHLADIASTSTAVKMEKGKFGGDINIRGVRAGFDKDDSAKK